MKKILEIVLFLFSLFLSSCVYKNDTSSLDMTMESDHFIIKYSENNNMSDILDQLESTYTYFSNTYNIALDQKTEVYIYPNIEDYHNKTGQKRAENWNIGLTEKQGIFMVSPYNPGDVHDYEAVIETAGHEYIHYITIKIIPESIYSLPAWLTDGIAVYESGQYISMKKDVEKGIKEYGGIPSLKKLANYSDFAKFQGYYIAPAIIHFLIENYGGRQKIIELIKNKGDVKKVYGKTEKELESECVKYYTS